MVQDLRQKYLDLSQEKLFQILLNSNEYTPEAFETAKKVAEEQGWMEELNALLGEKQKKLEQEEDEYERDVAEKAEYYKQLLNFKEQKCSFEVRIADIPKFESVLEGKEIQFFREDKNIGPQIDIYPTQTYYFKTEDSEKVDQIVKDIELITAPYFDYKPFIKMEVLVVIAVILIGLICLAIFA